MKWIEFLQIIQNAVENWQEILKSFPKYDVFLKGCFLIISYGGHKQIVCKRNMSIFDLSDNLDVFIESPFSNDPSGLLSGLKRAEMHRLKFPHAIHIDREIDNLKSAILSIPVQEMAVIENFDITVIFPSVNMKIIQKVKEHHLVNKEKTCLCKCCKGVYLH